MKRLLLSIVVAGLLSGVAVADEFDKKKMPPYPAPSPGIEFAGGITPTPEMWYYMQETRRHDDPAQAVRRVAERDAAARQARMQASKWYGISNSRPPANPVPFMATYSPFWAGNYSDPYRFNVGTPTIVIAR